MKKKERADRTLGSFSVACSISPSFETPFGKADCLFARTRVAPLQKATQLAPNVVGRRDESVATARPLFFFFIDFTWVTTAHCPHNPHCHALFPDQPRQLAMKRTNLPDDRVGGDKKPRICTTTRVFFFKSVACGDLCFSLTSGFKSTDT
ncbi:hypothetical protein BC940DRAFT_292142 [Gongronella butleri]|nr:hypothetical protein BC940DRAFT_292142 [Gongronella butleri]